MVMRIIMEHDDDLDHPLPEEMERPISDYPWMALNKRIFDAHGNLLADCTHDSAEVRAEVLRANSLLMAQAPALVEAVINAAAVFRRYERRYRKKGDVEQMRHNRIYAEKLEELAVAAIGKPPVKEPQ